MANFLVIGEQCLDVFVYGESNRLSPEAPVPVFIPSQKRENRGMAANVLNNLASIAFKDGNTSTVKSILSDCQSVKTRYVDAKTNHYFLRVDEESSFERICFGVDAKDKICAADCIVVSDYNKGFLELDDLKKISRLKGRNCPLIIDTKRQLELSLFDHVDFIKLNRKEYTENVIQTHKRNFAGKFIVTLGSEGAMHCGRTYLSRNPINTIDVSGAGDTFTAALAYRYTQTRSMGEAIEFANEMAGLVVSQRGVSVV